MMAVCVDTLALIINAERNGAGAPLAQCAAERHKGQILGGTSDLEIGWGYVKHRVRRLMTARVLGTGLGLIERPGVDKGPVVIGEM